jgi:hypothetical protein
VKFFQTKIKMSLIFKSPYVYSCEIDSKVLNCFLVKIIEGNAEVFKEKVEFDDASRTVTLVGVEGDVMKSYKTFKVIFKVAPKAVGGLATLTIEYEKLRSDVPAPNQYFTMMLNIAKDVDAHLVKA